MLRLRGAATEVIIRRYYLSFRLWRGCANSKLRIFFTERYTSLHFLANLFDLFEEVLSLYRTIHFAATRHSLSQKAIPYVRISFTRYRRRTEV